MKKITVITVATRNNIFLDDDYKIGELTYPDWFSLKAKITINDGSSYYLEPKGMFSSGIEVKGDGEVLFTTLGSWKGYIMISDVINKRDYTLKMQGFFSNGYVVTDSNNKELFRIAQIFSWKQFRTSYEIELIDFDLFHKQDELLLFIAFYSYKTFMTAMANGY